jgi:DNA-binding NarL/FixJ family response regulator
MKIDSQRDRVSRPIMSTPDALSPQELAMLELCAEGLSDREVAARLQVRRRAISGIQKAAAAKLAVRIASAHPFQIQEVTLARCIDSMEL